MPAGAETAARAAREAKKNKPPPNPKMGLRRPSLLGVLLKIYFSKEKLMTPSVTTVEVKSAWLSKINWKEALTIAAVIGAYFGIDLDANTQAAILAAIASGSAIVGWILRTFFTKTITPSVAAK
jgi:hypothetical protein